MHVALWSPAWPLEKHQNGVVTYVHWTRRELERLGHRVSIFAGVNDGDDDPRVYRVERGRLGRWVRRAASALFPADKDILASGEIIGAGFRELHQREPIDIIEMEESFGWFADVARVSGIPMLVKLHGPAFLSLIDEERETDFGRQKIEAEGRALADAAAIASPCGITLEQTVARYRLAPLISQHIVNPLTMPADLPLWSLARCDRDTILFVGRFDKRKGADIVLRAFAALHATRPALQLMMVGPDSGLLQADGERLHFEAFRDSVLPEAARSRVAFLGRLPNAEIARLRTRAMLTLVASRWENPGYTALEAMLQGCPVVCSDAGGCPEIIEHGVTGLLARSEDVDDFSRQMAAMLEDGEAAAAMGVAARAYVVREHAAAKVAVESLDLYQRVIAQHAAMRKR